MAERKLSEDEGTFLALLLRAQPTTGYQLSKIYELSPVSNLRASKGKLYPMIARFQLEGLVVATRRRRGTRHVEQLSCTRDGEEAVRKWLLAVQPEHFLLEDPLRTRIQSFELLTKLEQMEWLIDAKAGLQAKLEELEAYSADVTMPFKDWVRDNAVGSLRARIDWVDRMLLGTRSLSSTERTMSSRRTSRNDKDG